MEVTVRYLAALKEQAGVAEERLELPRGTTVASLLERVFALHPDLEELRSSTMVSVNRGVGTGDLVLEHGDDVALFPPIEGG